MRAAFFFDPNGNVIERQKAACAKPPFQQIGSIPYGFPVGIGATAIFEKGLLMPPEELRAWVAQQDRANARPYIAGCVQYSFNDVVHHTPFVFEVDKASNKYPQGFDVIDPTKDAVLAKQMRFMIPPWFNGQSD